MQASARVNEAYRTLRDPVARAEYLLLLHGFDATARTDAGLPVAFLTRQLERREAAEAARAAGDMETLARLADALRADAALAAADVERLLDGGGDPKAARDRVRELRFLTRVADDVDDMRADERATDDAVPDLPSPDASPLPHRHKRAIGIDLGTTNSLVATVRNGLAGRAARRRGTAARAVGRPLWRARDRRRLRRAGARRRGPAQHDRIGQAAHGPRPRRPRRRPPLSVPLRRRRRA